MPLENRELILQELVRRSNEDGRRLRSIEQRLETLESRLIALEDGILEKSKSFNAKFAEAEVSQKLVSEELIKLKNSLERINLQLPKFARRTDLREIENMLNLISPVNQEFVTKKQLEDELHEREEIIR